MAYHIRRSRREVIRAENKRSTLLRHYDPIGLSRPFCYHSPVRFQHVPPTRDTTMALPFRASRLVTTLGVFALAGCTAVITSCIKEYDLNRPDYERGTLGEELHRIWVKDTERSPTDTEERTALLEDNEQRFINAVDNTVPPGHVHELDQFFKSAVWFIEDKYVPATTRRLGILLDDASHNDELLESLGDRPPYASSDFIAPQHRGAAVGAAADYDELLELLGHLGAKLQNQDGFDEHGDIGGPANYAELLRYLADVIDGSPPDDGTDRMATTIRDVFFSPNNRYRIGDAPRDHRVALFDDRGVPKVRLDDGEVPPPFVDEQGDGFADIDDDGRFILDDGTHLHLSPMGLDDIDHPDLHRDPFGHVNRGPDRPAFAYVDISNTPGPYLIQLWADLVDEGIFHDIFKFHRDVFGPTEAHEDDRGVFQGYADDHPLVDIIDALVTALYYDGLPQSLELTARYLRSSADDLAFVSYAFGDVAGELTDYPDADIYDNQTLLDDALEVLREIAEDPELWADVMEALRDPVVEHTGEAMTTLVSYRDQQVVPIEHREDAGEGDEGDYDQCFYDCDDEHDIGTVERMECIRDCPLDELFSDEMQFDEPESKDNRSVLQRLFHLLRDTAGVEYKLEIEELEEPWLGLDPEDLPPIIELPGAAEAFLRTVAGKLHLEDFISPQFEDSDLGSLLQSMMGDSSDESVAAILSSASEMFGFRLDTEPTPDQITRLFNQPNIETDFDDDDDVHIGIRDPRCKDGFVMADHHADGLFAAEASGLIDTIQPLAVAFARHDREDLLAELFVIVHDHYSAYDDLYVDADGNPSPMKASNLASVEAVLHDIFDDGQIFEALRALAVSTDGLTDDDGVDADERIRQLLYELIRDDDGFQARSEPTSIELADGRQLDNPSRIQIVFHRLQTWLDRHEDDEELYDQLSSLGERMLDVTLSPTQVDDDHFEFDDDLVLFLLADLLEHTGARAAEMNDRGELEPWLTEDIPDGFADFYSSRGFFSFNQLMWEFQDDEQGRELLDGLALHFAEDPARADYLSMMAYGLVFAAYDLAAYMPAAHIILDGLDPDAEVTVGPHRDIANATLFAILLENMPDVDKHRYGIETLRRGALGSNNAEPGWSVLTDILARYFSAEPSSDEPLTAQDWELVLRRIGDWLHDDMSGLERYYELIEYRGNMELEEF